MWLLRLVFALPYWDNETFPQTDSSDHPNLLLFKMSWIVSSSTQQRIWREEFNFATHAKVVDAQITSWKAKFKAADLELIKLKTRASDLEAEILALKSSSTSPYNCCTATLLGDGSSPVSSCSSSSSMEDIKTSPLGFTAKKRKVAAHCRFIMKDLNDVCDKYNELLACVLGNCFLYGNEEDKKDVSNNVWDFEPCDGLQGNKKRNQGSSPGGNPPTSFAKYASARLGSFVFEDPGQTPGCCLADSA